MNSYFVAKTKETGFIDQLTLEELAKRVRTGEIPGDYVATKSTASSYNQLMESGAAAWITVSKLVAISELLRPDETLQVMVPCDFFLKGPRYGGLHFTYPCNLYITSHRLLIEDTYSMALLFSPLLLLAWLSRDRGTYSVESHEITTIKYNETLAATAITITYKQANGSTQRIVFGRSRDQSEKIRLFLMRVKAGRANQLATDNPDKISCGKCKFVQRKMNTECQECGATFE